MINGGLLFIAFMVIWVVFGFAKDAEARAKSKEAEDATQTKNKKVGKRNV